MAARTVSGPQLASKGRRSSEPSLVARLGTWLSFTVVLENRSRKPFRFGRSCPAYTEGIETQNQAYVLNFHAIGSIGSRQSVRLAMRVHVPRHRTDPESFPPLGWTLAPHSWDAPGALAVVDLR